MIIFIHRGSQYYLFLALAQARASNPESEIVLLGDNQALMNPDFFLQYRINFDLISSYLNSASIFKKIYVHDSSNTFEYERFCFERWFIVKDYIEKNGITKNFCCLDSDAILYAHVGNVFNLLKSDLNTCDCVGPQFLFFKSIDILKQYCNFITSVFIDESVKRELYTFISKNRAILPSHINDMATLGLFAKKKALVDIGIESEIGVIFDENVIFSQGLITNFFGKRIFRVHGASYFKRRSGEYIRAGGIHAQGQSKQFMILYVDRSVAFALINYRIVHEFLNGLIRIMAESIKTKIKKAIRCIS